MEPLDAYVIPVTSLRMGVNDLEFTADWQFFQRFEDSPVQQGRFQIGLVFDRQPDHWHLIFDVSGTVDTECDRCLAPIALPVEGEYELYVKCDGEAATEDEGPEVLHLPRETTKFDITQYLYEFIILSVPISKRYDCEAEEVRPCDMTMLAKLAAQQEETPGDIRWDILKDLPLSEEGIAGQN